jgi:hypothetical protein
MKKPTLPADDAAALFNQLMREIYPDDGTPTKADRAPETAEEAEAHRFRCAETLLRLVCPDPARCREAPCRRARHCQHLAQMGVEAQAVRRKATRRTPGAAAMRYAMAVYMEHVLARAESEAGPAAFSAGEPEA